MRRVTHERYISQSQWVNCDLARRYVGLNLSQQYIIMSIIIIQGEGIGMHLCKNVHFVTDFRQGVKGL